jgi:hypothetical protein
MRYEDWDILIFPRDLAIPMKEFKVACHVVHDTGGSSFPSTMPPEFAHTHGSFGLPTMTGFIPSLATGTPFNISVHSWKFPEISQFTKAYSKHPELVKFEARVLIDGKFVAYVAPPEPAIVKMLISVPDPPVLTVRALGRIFSATASVSDHSFHSSRVFLTIHHQNSPRMATSSHSSSRCSARSFYMRVSGAPATRSDGSRSSSVKASHETR